MADITVIDNADDSYARLNGQSAVVLSVFKSSTAGTNEVSKNIAAAISELEEQYPGLSVLTLMDQGDYITMIINGVLQSMIVGAAPVSYTHLEAAKNGYERIVTSVDNLKFLLDKAADTEMTGEEKNLLTEAQGFETKFDEAMDDDFNTADALAAIFELVKFVNSNAKAESSKAFLEALKQEIVTLSDICGLIVDKKAEMLDSDIEALIEERQAARKAKNFARADEIRDELLAKGIVLEDTREGVKWKRA